MDFCSCAFLLISVVTLKRPDYGTSIKKTDSLAERVKKMQAQKLRTEPSPPKSRIKPKVEVKEIKEVKETKEPELNSKEDLQFLMQVCKSMMFFEVWFEITFGA